MIHTTEHVKSRLQEIADKHGWSLSKTGHLALEEWLEEQDDE